MKRILSMMLAILIMTTMSVLPASAEGKKSGLFTYELKGNGTAVITGFDWESNWQTKKQEQEDIYIPRMIDGYTVTGIGDRAFSDISYYEDEGNIAVILPDTITSIGDFAFWQVDCIATMNIPSSVQFIGKGVFNGTGCRLSVDTNNETFATINNALYNKKLKELIYGSARGNIPEGILSIGDYACYVGGTPSLAAFTGKSLGPVVLPSTITKIGAYAFSGASIYEISLPESLTSIGDYAFSDAYIEECCLPKSLTSIGDYAFKGAIWHTGAIVSDGSITIYGSTDNIQTGSAREVLYVPQNVEHIGVGAFMNCKPSDKDDAYYSIVLGNCKIEEIPDRAFEGVVAYRGNSIRDKYNTSEGETIREFGSSIVCWPESLRVIGEKAFANAELSLSTLPTSITQIEANAFQNTEFLWVDNSTFTLPEGLESLGENAFDGCSGLGKIVLPTTLTSIGDNFCDRTRITLQVESGTYPAIWASENGYPTTSAGGDDTSWLNG